jgi:hypothetical protein
MAEDNFKTGDKFYYPAIDDCVSLVSREKEHPTDWWATYEKDPDRESLFWDFELKFDSPEFDKHTQLVYVENDKHLLLLKLKYG